MRILHTADWHLGQTLHGISRAWEHARFFEHLLDTLIPRHAVDALVIAGDVFDVGSPPAEAQRAYYAFLAEARRKRPALDIVVVGGNHDAPARLDAPGALLSALGVTVVGGLPLTETGDWDLERLLVPLRGASGEVEALMVALPYLRPSDLPRSRAEAWARAGLDSEPDEPSSEGRRDLVDGHRDVYAALVEAAKRRCPSGAALLATGHAYVAGGQLSELSERKIQQGNQQALPASIFPEDLAYVALGHLHLGQTVSERPMARYSGSPLPLSMAELGYDHHVLLVETRGEKLHSVIPCQLPRAVPLKRLPEVHAPLEEVLPLLEALPRAPDPGAEPTQAPLLEVRVRLERAEPRLRRQIEAALDGAWVRLVRIDVERPAASSEAESAPTRLTELQPEEVFRAAVRRARGAEPTDELLAAFHELVETVGAAE